MNRASDLSKNSSKQINESSVTEPELKVEHAIVLRTLKAANRASRRLVSTLEITQSLSENEAAQIKSAYQQGLVSTVGKILTLLQARGLVFSPGKSANNRYYGATAVFPSGDVLLPDKQTHRGRVLRLVRSATDHFGRAVRIGDIMKYAEEWSEATNLDLSTISSNVLSLAQTEDLRVVGIVRGENNGNNLYLPSELDPALYMPKEPLTWLEEVAQAFNAVWIEHQKKAKLKNQLPKPVSTGEVRARWVASPNPHPKSRERQPVINAMSMLAKNSRKQPPLLRKIRRKGEKAILWAPIDIPNEQLDIGDAHISDAERIGIAVKRAAEQLGRPVTVRDITDEVELDPSLRPTSSIPIRNILSDLSKDKVAAEKGKRKRRSHQRVYRIGSLENVTYYYHCSDGLEVAHAYVELRRIESQWFAMSAEERLDKIRGCLVPSLIIGGARLICAEAQSLHEALNVLLSREMEATTLKEAADLLKRIKVVINEADALIDSNNDESQELPEKVLTDTPSLTLQELFSLLLPLHQNLQDNKDIRDLNALLCKAIRRIPNPDFKNRFSKEARGAAEFLFDRTDALFYAARRWGGPECSFQANVAKDELGWLRDARYVFPALRATDIRIRLSGIACLAFLSSIEGNTQLQQIAIEDPEPGVRQSAIWAYGFAGGDRAIAFAQERYEQEENIHLRKFAKKAINLDEKGWWAL